MKNWYSRLYLGRSFDIFLASELKQKDFMRLQSELQSVSEQLLELNSFIASGYPNKIGGIHIKRKEAKESST